MDRTLTETKITIGGFGGQGIVVIGNLIARAAVIENKNVTGMVAYGAEMRGGTASATVVVSDDEIASPYVDRPNMAIILNHPSLEHYEPTITPGGLITLNTSLAHRGPLRGDLSVIEVGATEIAHELGNIRTANIVILGAFIEHTMLLRPESVRQAITDLFSGKNPKYVPLNLEAFEAGARRSRLLRPATQK
jgi:2-oxoglutarate ferredoxin oxidoreductase subunit gamma